MKILTFTQYYLPAYKAGGPIRTVANMVEQLYDEHEFYIVTSDRDLYEEESFSNITPDCWTKIGNAMVYYTSPQKNSIGHLKNLIANTSHDIIYLNSFFSIKFSLLPLVLVNWFKVSNSTIILAPRGELSKGALSIKFLKKKAFISIVKRLGLYKNVIWHASSGFEKDDIQNVFSFNPESIIVAPNIPGKLTKVEDNDLKMEEGKMKIIFLSRISPKKNLHYALRILKKIDILIDFDIYGVIDDQVYWKKCLNDIENMPKNIFVRYMGAVEHQKVGLIMKKYHLFFLPTKGENYGHAIAEALSAGIPVLISNTTPWLALEQAGVGWDLPLENTDAFCSAITNYHKKLLNEQPISNFHIFEWISQRLEDYTIIKTNKGLFNVIRQRNS